MVTVCDSYDTLFSCGLDTTRKGNKIFLSVVRVTGMFYLFTFIFILLYYVNFKITVVFDCKFD